MDECRLKLDIQYYVDLAGTDLFHLLSGPEPEMRVIENWQTEGFDKGREFRLVSELEDAACTGKVHCQFLCGMTLDKHMVRYLSEVDSDNVGRYNESSLSPRTAAFQPKLKPRARKGGAGGGAGAEAAVPTGQSGSAAGPSGRHAAPAGNVGGAAQAVAPPVRATAAAAATVPSGRTSASAQRPLPDAPASGPQLPSRSAAPEALGLSSPAPSLSATVIARETHQAEGLGSVQGGFDAPSRTATAAPSPAATAATGARASSASAPAAPPIVPSSRAPTLPAPDTSARPPPRAPAPALENGPHINAARLAHTAAAPSAAPGTAPGAAEVAVRGNGRGREKEKGVSGADKSQGVIGSGTKGVFFPHSFRKGKRRSQVTPELLAAEDLSGFTIQQIIQRSEVLDREKEKEEQEKKRIEEEVERNRRKLARRRGEEVLDGSESPGPSAPASNPPPSSSGGGGGVFAPQVTVIDGRIVVNEASLTVDAQGGRDEAMEGYKRVEESSARLNYGTHMKREKSDRWSVDETTQWYQALQQFGTDFEMLQALFPKRSRRQMKAKFKREETLHPHLVTHALTHRCTDTQQYERLASALNPQLALQVRETLAGSSASPPARASIAATAAASAGAVAVRGREEASRQRVSRRQQGGAVIGRPGAAVAAATAAAANALHNIVASASAAAVAAAGGSLAGAEMDDGAGNEEAYGEDEGMMEEVEMEEWRAVAAEPAGEGEEGRAEEAGVGLEEAHGEGDGVDGGEEGMGEGDYGGGDYGAGADGTGEYGVVTQESAAATQVDGDYGEAEYGEGEEEMGGTIGYEDPFAAYGGDGEVEEEEDPLGGYG
ncbi:unnamed protein product [Closterium sp. NIES-65]|nr:unnamed protein product [Closterium sp. NIES-65]